ncbi:heparin lyase I family protein [Marinobacter sp. es.042]|uniref:heparin lyase I family protein n=1 Tax=Marinobacter sp. es.042 TaxID=1761794 RepID=UPI0012F8D9E1|nr:heparin lyase I family protein [Marinobacter sp. es.042]
MRLLRCLFAFYLSFLVGVSSAHGEIIFEDDFTGFDFSKSMSGAGWDSQRSVNVVDAPSVVNAGVAQFLFEGSSDASGDAFSELRFDLGKLYPEVWLQYYLFIPANYFHRDAPGPDNNKILRVWGTSYDDVEKVGLSVWAGSSGDSRLIVDWNRGGDGIGPKGEGVGSFIGASDRGKWMKIRVHLVAAKSSASPGSIRVWKNNNLIINELQTVNNFYSGEAHAYRYGYLMGWSNSGFDEATRINIDGVVFATSADDLENGQGAVQFPPSPPQINVE